MMKLLYIDLFCGAGGTSTGVESAIVNGKKCAKVIACVNHDPNAIASHAANHPDALHFTEDIRTLELSTLINHTNKMKRQYPEALLVLWASLECTNFSKAKGGQPRNADSRTLAEHLFRYIEALQPDYIHIENVEEFMSWGDVDENGKPISTDKGKSYIKWVNNVIKFDYKFQYKILNSADYGAYTSRRRFFGIFAKNGLPISFPSPTYSKKPENNLFSSSIKKWKPVREVLELEDEGQSIFIRKKNLSDKTLERIYAGLVKFIAKGEGRWMLKYNSVNGKTGKHNPPSIDEPCPVVSVQNRLGLVKCQFLSKQFSGSPESKNQSIELPAGTITTIDHHAFVSAYYGNGHNHSIDNPCPTITTRDRFSIVTSHLISDTYSEGCQLADIDNICPILLTSKEQKNENCFLMNPQYKSAGGSVNNPCFTLIASMDKMPPYLITTKNGDVGVKIYDDDTESMKKIKKFMAIYGIIDIRMRMLRVHELKRIMGFPSDYVLIGTQSEQKKYIGNAVEVNMARVLCENICGELLILNSKN